MSEQSKAYREGYEAYYRDETAEVCPYKFGTVACFDWLKGHGDAEDEAERIHGPTGVDLLPMDPPAKP